MKCNIKLIHYFHLLRFDFKKCCFLDLSKKRLAELFGQLPHIEPLYLLSGIWGDILLMLVYTRASTQLHSGKATGEQEARLGLEAGPLQ